MTVSMTFASAEITVTMDGEALEDSALVLSGNVLTANCEAADYFEWKYSGETVHVDATYNVLDSFEHGTLLSVYAYDRNSKQLGFMVFLYQKTTYTVNIAEGIEHCSVSFRDSYTSRVEVGSSLYLTITPNEDYELDTVTVTGDSSETYNFESSTNSFPMTTENVNVTVTFKVDEDGETEPFGSLAVTRNGQPLGEGATVYPDDVLISIRVSGFSWMDNKGFFN